ncbi:unnamed protein product, partial [Polarella glacialis]
MVGTSATFPLVPTGAGPTNSASGGMPGWKPRLGPSVFLRVSADSAAFGRAVTATTVVAAGVRALRGRRPRHLAVSDASSTFLLPGLTPCASSSTARCCAGSASSASSSSSAPVASARARGLLTGLPGSRSFSERAATAGGPAVARLTASSAPAVAGPEVESFRCAPRGLAAALAEAMGLPAGATAEDVAAAAAAPGSLAERAELLADQLVAGDLTKIVGPGKLLDSPWILAGRSELRAKLVQLCG